MNLTAKQKMVMDAIKVQSEAANDDALLLASIWSKEASYKGIMVSTDMLYGILKNVTRPETISRRRRELHNMGLIEYSKKADKRREEAFINERNIHSETKGLI